MGASPLGIAVPLLWSPWRWGCLAALGLRLLRGWHFPGSRQLHPQPCQRDCA